MLALNLFKGKVASRERVQLAPEAAHRGKGLVELGRPCFELDSPVAGLSELLLHVLHSLHRLLKKGWKVRETASRMVFNVTLLEAPSPPP